MTTPATTADRRPVLVLGATGKTGRRVLRRLQQRGVPVRAGSRTASPPFDWEDGTTWAPALAGTRAVYVSYYPDLALPGAPEAVGRLTGLAVAAGVGRVVLLSGRGEPEAQRAEQVVADVLPTRTVLRCSWFAQNFDEGQLAPAVGSGELALPVGEVREPFVDADDIADVAVAALLEGGHEGQVYELTGPRAVTFAEAMAVVARATGRSVAFRSIGVDDFRAGLAAVGVPGAEVDLLTYLVTTVLDGRGATPADGVRRALGREPRDLETWAAAARRAGAWSTASATAASPVLDRSS
ncbi:NmrA family transcriptional regulator [Aquipuribacter sp. MA13-6]|uniref:NmrA family transcriptional regulator n=1 Tax=unclassified Aquipuribacter TaxID=2635084 RepID=UPI003EE83469